MAFSLFMSSCLGFGYLDPRKLNAFININIRSKKNQFTAETRFRRKSKLEIDGWKIA